MSLNKQAVLELAVFTVKAGFESDMPQLRNGLREALKDFDGLIEYRGYSPIGTGRVFVDLAHWDSLEHAQAVAQAFAQGDPRFTPYAKAIESIAFMEHVQSE